MELKQMEKNKRSYIGNPYMNSDRKARIYTSMSSASSALKRKRTTGSIFQIGKGNLFVIKQKGRKYYSK